MIIDFKLFENVERAKKLLISLNIDPQKDESYNKIRQFLKNMDGYVYWFCKLHFEDKVPLNELEEVAGYIRNNRQIIQKFPKNIIDLESIEEFWDNWNKVINELKVKKIINELPSLQKSFIDWGKDFDILLNLANNKNKQNFLKKVSRYKNKNEFIRALSFFLSNKMEDGFNNILKFLNESGIKPFYKDEENDIIVIIVKYDDILKVGRDTSWCIVRSESTFNGYVCSPLSRQFVIFLTDREDNYSKIGVTTNYTGYYTSHLKNDQRIDKDSLKSLLEERGFDFKLLLPSRESILRMDLTDVNKANLVDILSKEEILERTRRITFSSEIKALNITKEDLEKYKIQLDLNINEIIQGNINREKLDELGVEYDINEIMKHLTFDRLLKFGFSEDEIYLNKNNFTDFEIIKMKKENIIKYNLFSKIVNLEILSAVDKSIDLKIILNVIIDRKPENINLINIVRARVQNAGDKIDKETINLISSINFGQLTEAYSKVLIYIFKKKRETIINNLNKKGGYLYRYDIENEVRIKAEFYIDREILKEVKKLMIIYHDINLSEVNLLELSRFIDIDVSETLNLFDDISGFDFDIPIFSKYISDTKGNRHIDYISSELKNLNGKFLDSYGKFLLDFFKYILSSGKYKYINANIDDFCYLFAKIEPSDEFEIRKNFNFKYLSVNNDEKADFFEYLLSNGLIDVTKVKDILEWLRNSNININKIPKSILSLIPDNEEYLELLLSLGYKYDYTTVYAHCVENNILLNTIRNNIKIKIKEDDGTESNRLYDILKQIEKDKKELDNYEDMVKYNTMLTRINKISSGLHYNRPNIDSEIEKFYETFGDYVLKREVKDKLLKSGKARDLIVIYGTTKKLNLLPEELVIFNFGFNFNGTKEYYDYLHGYLKKSLPKNIKKINITNDIKIDIDENDLDIRTRLFNYWISGIGNILVFLTSYFPKSNLIDTICEFMKNIRNNDSYWNDKKEAPILSTNRVYPIKNVFERLIKVGNKKEMDLISKMLNIINPTKLERERTFKYLWGATDEQRKWLVDGGYKQKHLKESRIFNFRNFNHYLK